MDDYFFLSDKKKKSEFRLNFLSNNTNTTNTHNKTKSLFNSTQSPFISSLSSTKGSNLFLKNNLLNCKEVFNTLDDRNISLIQKKNSNKNRTIKLKTKNNLSNEIIENGLNSISISNKKFIKQQTFSKESVMIPKIKNILHNNDLAIRQIPLSARNINTKIFVLFSSTIDKEKKGIHNHRYRNIEKNNKEFLTETNETNRSKNQSNFNDFNKMKLEMLKTSLKLKNKKAMVNNKQKKQKIENPIRDCMNLANDIGVDFFARKQKSSFVNEKMIKKNKLFEKLNNDSFILKLDSSKKMPKIQNRHEKKLKSCNKNHNLRNVLKIYKNFSNRIKTNKIENFCVERENNCLERSLTYINNFIKKNINSYQKDNDNSLEDRCNKEMKKIQEKIYNKYFKYNLDLTQNFLHFSLYIGNDYKIINDHMSLVFEKKIRNKYFNYIFNNRNINSSKIKNKDNISIMKSMKIPNIKNNEYRPLLSIEKSSIKNSMKVKNTDLSFSKMENPDYRLRVNYFIEIDTPIEFSFDENKYNSSINEIHKNLINYSLHKFRKISLYDYIEKKNLDDIDVSHPLENKIRKKSIKKSLGKKKSINIDGSINKKITKEKLSNNSQRGALLELNPNENEINSSPSPKKLLKEEIKHLTFKEKEFKRRNSQIHLSLIPNMLIIKEEGISDKSNLNNIEIKGINENDTKKYKRRKSCFRNNKYNKTMPKKSYRSTNSHKKTVSSIDYFPKEKLKKVFSRFGKRTNTLSNNEIQIIQKEDQQLSSISNYMLKNPVFQRTQEIKISCRNNIKKTEEMIFFLIKERAFHEFLKYIERKKINYDAVNENLDTFLIYSVLCNEENFVLYFLSIGVDVNKQNKYGNTALHYAFSDHNYSMADLLLQHGADESIKNNNGETPWQCLNETNLNIQNIFYKN